jgi:hypothetical protein
LTDDVTLYAVYKKDAQILNAIFHANGSALS